MKNHVRLNRIISAAVMVIAAIAVVAVAMLNFEPKQPVPEDETVDTAVASDVADEEENTGLTYEEGLKSVNSIGALKESGYMPTDAVFDPNNCRIGLLKPTLTLPEIFSFADGQKRKVTRSSNGNGGFDYTESYVPASEPAIRVYGGYLLISDGERVSLADSGGTKILVNDLSGFTPAYQRDIYGHPLFEKGGTYFYYYEPSSDAIKQQAFTFRAEDGTELSLPQEELPQTVGMIEAIVDTAYFQPIYYDYSYSSCLDTGGIYRYHEHEKRYILTNVDEIYQNRLDMAIENYRMTQGVFPEERTAEIEPEISERDGGYSWQYIDADGNTLFYKSGKTVCDFSPDGFAVVVNWSNRITVMDKREKTVIDPYETLVYLQEAENPLNDCYILPDTFGIESLGMFKFDGGALRVRRRLIDRGNGNYAKSETQILISTDGKILNYPRSYTLVGYSDGLMLLEKDGKYGYMDIYGNWVVKPSYTYAEPFSEGLAVVGYKNATYGMIDKNGDTALPKIYKYVSTCSSGTIAAYSDKGGWTIYRKTTNAEIPERVNPVILRTKKDAALLEYEKEKMIKETIEDADKEAAAAVEELKLAEAAAAETAQIGSIEIPAF